MSFDYYCFVVLLSLFYWSICC